MIKREFFIGIKCCFTSYNYYELCFDNFYTNVGMFLLRKLQIT